MTEERFSAAPVLAQLKDFQRATVDYVFGRLYGPAPTHRFLVADEVGLGKTLVARGLIARALEHLHDQVKRVDVVYVCSNAAIAAQNINRLNVTGQQVFARASRLTLLPTQVHELDANRVNFVSFTPGTTFDLRSRGGTAEERALIYFMLKGADWDSAHGLMNLLQATVTNRDAWKARVLSGAPRFDPDLAQAFRAKVADDPDFVSRLRECCQRFRRFRKHVPAEDSNARYDLIGELRQKLAQTCLQALEPDLVILDEFQRFKDLLNGEDEAAILARELFNYPGVRTLLLSATPYKMLSLDHEQDDDHYPDFLRTLRFLLDDADAVECIRADIQHFRKQLFALGRQEHTDIVAARDRLQHSLLRVMCRTERVGMTQRLDAMVSEPPRRAPLAIADLHQASAVDLAARTVGAGEPMEYWKSSPYLLNFLKNYDLRRRIDNTAACAPDDLLTALHQAKAHLLTKAQFDAYAALDPGNARMRLLFADTIERGLWRLLWMPPSLPYSAPGGAYADVGDATKSLVFSSWNLVPDAIAAICSYDAERRMTEELDKSVTHSDLYDQLRPLLRFAKGRDDRLSGMPVLAWLLPSPTLASTVDPLAIARRKGGDTPIAIDELIAQARDLCRTLLKSLPPGNPGQRPDERWYWAAPALLTAQTGAPSCLAEQAAATAVAEPAETETRFQDHLKHYLQTAAGALDLGPRPQDLDQVLAELALAAPGNCALRALRRIAPGLAADDPSLLAAALQVAQGFRTLFNLPESIALLRGSDGDETYWRRTLQYSLEGNIQALLDEQTHVLVEQLGLTNQDDASRVLGVSCRLADALSIRTSQLKIDELRPTGQRIEQSSFNTRCRFALRFGDLRDDSDKTLARADVLRDAFNSPFRPFILASTSIGQEGLDFHTWCHAVVHWNLPTNPVDLEQREGRVHRYKGHAVRKNIAEHYGLGGLEPWDGRGDPWDFLFNRARQERPAGSSDLIPFWIFEEGSARIERRVPLIPFSQDVGRFERLKRNLALYRLVFGQPRQQDLLTHLAENLSDTDSAQAAREWRISLQPPESSSLKGNTID